MPYLKSFSHDQARVIGAAFREAFGNLLPIRLESEQEGGTTRLFMHIPAHHQDESAVHFEGTVTIYKAMFSALEAEGVVKAGEIMTQRFDEYDPHPVKRIAIALTTGDMAKLEPAFARAARQVKAQLQQIDAARNALLPFIGSEPVRGFFHDEPLMGKHLILIKPERRDNGGVSNFTEWGKLQKCTLDELKKSGAIDVEWRDEHYVISLRDLTKLHTAIAQLGGPPPGASRGR